MRNSSTGRAETSAVVARKGASAHAGSGVADQIEAAGDNVPKTIGCGRDSADEGGVCGEDAIAERHRAAHDGNTSTQEGVITAKCAIGDRGITGSIERAKVIGFG